MSIEADNADNENTIINQNDEIIKLLRAILLGIESITDQENIINNVEE